MRTLFVSLLIAGSAASPALAQDRDFDNRRSERDADSGERVERSGPMLRHDDGTRSAASEQRREERRAQVVNPVIGDAGMTTTAPADSGRGRRFDRPFGGRRDGGSSGIARGWAGGDARRERDGDVALGSQTSVGAPVTVGTNHRDGGRRWDGQWRSDRRYDWRSHRDRHRSLFRFGSYYDPYGYGYRRFSIGFSLFPSYYRSSYWLNDPWQYRLPPAYGPYRWVRYWDDALLVNIYTGQVVDVERNFFW